MVGNLFQSFLGVAPINMLCQMAFQGTLERTQITGKSAESTMNSSYVVLEVTRCFKFLITQKTFVVPTIWEIMDICNVFF